MTTDSEEHITYLREHAKERRELALAFGTQVAQAAQAFHTQLHGIDKMDRRAALREFVRVYTQSLASPYDVNVNVDAILREMNRRAVVRGDDRLRR